MLLSLPGSLWLFLMFNWHLILFSTLLYGWSGSTLTCGCIISILPTQPLLLIFQLLQVLVLLFLLRVLWLLCDSLFGKWLGWLCLTCSKGMGTWSTFVVSNARGICLPIWVTHSNVIMLTMTGSDLRSISLGLNSSDTADLVDACFLVAWILVPSALVEWALLLSWVAAAWGIFPMSFGASWFLRCSLARFIILLGRDNSYIIFRSWDSLAHLVQCILECSLLEIEQLLVKHIHWWISLLQP